MATAKAKSIKKPKQRTGLYHARSERGLSQQALADLVGTTKQTVARLELGRPRGMELTREWAERFAPHLRFGPQEILFWDLQRPHVSAGSGSSSVNHKPASGFAEGDADEHAGIAFAPGDAIPLVGLAEAGAFREMPGFDDLELHLRHIAAPRSKLYPKAKHFALEVRGDSMNAAKPSPILDGMYVLCIDVVSANIEVESGKIYAVRQTRDGGHTYECTIKRARVFRDRVELHPESTNPNHKPLVIRHATPEGSTNEIAAIGLVYFAGFDFEQ